MVAKEMSYRNRQILWKLLDRHLRAAGKWQVHIADSFAKWSLPGDIQIYFDDQDHEGATVRLQTSTYEVENADNIM